MIFGDDKIIKTGIIFSIYDAVLFDYWEPVIGLEPGKRESIKMVTTMDISWINSFVQYRKYEKWPFYRGKINTRTMACAAAAEVEHAWIMLYPERRPISSRKDRHLRLKQVIELSIHNYIKTLKEENCNGTFVET